jgi:hypothetical protein
VIHVVSSVVVSSPAASTPASARASRRVYTIAFALLLVVGAAVAALTTRASAPNAQDRMTVEARMTKGPATAPVTIVEFSDYQ